MLPFSSNVIVLTQMFTFQFSNARFFYRICSIFLMHSHGPWRTTRCWNRKVYIRNGAHCANRLLGASYANNNMECFARSIVYTLFSYLKYIPASGTSILFHCTKSRQNSVTHWFKARRYAHSYRRLGNFQMLSNKWRPIIADAVNHVSKDWLLKSVYTLCKWCK